MNDQHATTLAETHPLSGVGVSPERSEQEVNQDHLSKTKRSRRILVVDDSKEVRDITARLLRDLGHEVQTASDGTRALTKALEFRPQVMLIDIVMPGLNGFQLAERIRVNPLLCEIVLITLTGWDEDTDLWLSKNAGCDYHLVKPLDLEVLETYVQRGRRKIGDA